MADNQKTLGIEIESESVVCRRCKRTFAYLVIEQVKGITQLRAGDLLITKIDANCLHCGSTFSWNIREKDVEKMTVTYGEVLRSSGYVAE